MEERLYQELEQVADSSFSDDKKRPPLYPGFPVSFLKNKGIFPLRLENNVMTLVVDQPDDFDTLDAIRLATGFELKVMKGEKEVIRKAIDQHYASDGTSIHAILEGISPAEDSHFKVEEDDVGHLKDMASEAPIIRLVNLIITRAIEKEASDIHIEPFETSLVVRYRIDDLLQKVESLPRRLHAAVTSRIKIMSDLDIAERRLPQDGRIKMNLSDRDVDLRVATIPISYGESIVIRILDRRQLILSMDALGFSEDKREASEAMLSRPYGMILVTGPTGSGKTTTLYTTLEKLNSTDKKIMTIEDPVEYHLDGVNQVQVKPQIGFTFASGLRHIVRQDPNIIMVGEIRDRETAEIAVHSALTGHLVLSTLHTNDASGAIVRLLEMGVEDYLLSSSLIGIVAQRLVRVICQECSEQVFPHEKEVEKLREYLPKGGETTYLKGRGCQACGFTGYRGRTGIFEVLPIHQELRQTILKHPESSTIKKKAVQRGMMSLRQDGVRKVVAGITTIDEVIRVTQAE